MKEKYDVIIVGAGSAGLAAAEVLARNGKEVLVLEKNKTLGQKICANGLTVKIFEEVNIPKFVIERKFKSIDLNIYKSLTKLELEKDWIWTCNRKKLAEWQLEQAKKSGANIYLNTEVIEIQKDHIFINDNVKIKFQYLIGADGSNSLVRKFLNLKTKKMILAMQYLVFKKRFDRMSIFFNLKKFGPLYAWIFPYKNSTSIGVGADLKLMKIDKLKENFNNLCEEIGFDYKRCEFQAALINYDYRGVKFRNIFLAGDAAGLASGVTGEGIHPAIISGREVANKIINPKYNFKELKKILKFKKIEERILIFYRINKTITGWMFKFSSFCLKNKKIRKKLINFLTEK